MKIALTVLPFLFVLLLSGCGSASTDSYDAGQANRTNQMMEQEVER
ncbi:hypothetical protein [Ruficoccus sp. ZRK36]|nr:hypothetical protein [Ruficoccus sp. ZRK36]QYY34551.1 hypothetical protein K0V07_09565 [Ruficoccus sp. ZRK36]